MTEKKRRGDGREGQGRKGDESSKTEEETTGW